MRFGSQWRLAATKKNPTVISWLKDIDRATTEAEIVARARDYCSLISPRDLLPLPEDCRQIRIDNDADIPRLRERLARGCERARAHASELEKARQLVSYLSHAAERLGAIRSSH
jgi:hypothetical protein